MAKSFPPRPNSSASWSPHTRVIVSRYEILADGGGQDGPYLRASLEGHGQRFGRPPDLPAGDRGVALPTNEKPAPEFGVKRIVLARAGTISEDRRKLERAGWFRCGFRFRAGLEGRISVLKRRRGLDVCLNAGEVGFERWVGWGIVMANLARSAETRVGRAATATTAA